MVLSKCAISDSKKSRFIKNHKAKQLLSSLGIQTQLSKVSILGIFCFNIHAKSYKNEENS